MRRFLTEQETGTRTWWGREYHWALINGRLHLQRGPWPLDRITAEVSR